LARWYRPAMIGVILFGTVGFGINLTTQFLPQSDKQSNPRLAIAESLKMSNPNALFISDGNELDFHLAYFTQRDIV